MDNTFSEIQIEKNLTNTNKEFLKTKLNKNKDKEKPKNLKEILLGKSKSKFNSVNSSLQYIHQKEYYVKNERHIHSQLGNFIIQEENEIASSNENTPQKAFIGAFNQNEQIEDVDEQLEEDDHEFGNLNNNFGVKKDFSKVLDSAMNDLSLRQRANVELFKVTEEDTNQEKFSITVTSDKFRTKKSSSTSAKSDLQYLKKEESDNQIKDIYQIDLEEPSDSPFPDQDLKLLEQKYYNEMSSSNDMKNTQYKSDQKNCLYNSLNKEDNLLENIKESFSDHEQDLNSNESDNQNEEDDEHDENNSDYKETYTVNSSSDEEIIDHRQNTVFTEISQVIHNQLD